MTTIRRQDLDALDLSDIAEPGTEIMAPIHPGETLREDYLRPLGLSAAALTKALDVPANRITEIVKGRRDITADTALRLARFFGTDAQSWLNLQSAYDLACVRAAVGPDIDRIRPLAACPAVAVKQVERFVTVFAGSRCYSGGRTGWAVGWISAA